jgi:hypothetical protein
MVYVCRAGCKSRCFRQPQIPILELQSGGTCVDRHPPADLEVHLSFLLQHTINQHTWPSDLPIDRASTHTDLLYWGN